MAGRILICSALSPHYNGRLLKTAAALLDAGHDVEVAALAETGGCLQVSETQHVPLHAMSRDRRALPANGVLAKGAGFLRFRAFRRQLLGIFDKVGPDATHLLDYEVLAALEPRLTQTFAVYDAVEFFADTADGSGAARYVSALYDRTGGRIARVLTVSDALANALAASHPDLPPARVIPNAAPSLPSEVIASLQREATDDVPLVIYQGGFSRNRGLVDLIDAAHALRGIWRVALRGWGPEEEALRKRVEALFSPDDPDRPQILPPLAYWELPMWTATADIGLIPYRPGSVNHDLATPNKLYEYPAAGVPVLASDLPEIKAELERTGTGWTYDAEAAPASLISRLGQLSRSEIDEARRACLSLGEASTWQHYARILQQIYAEQ